MKKINYKMGQKGASLLTKGGNMEGKMGQKGASLLTKVLETIKKYNLIENGDKLVFGVSGGPDSISMLKILNDIRNDKNLHMEFDIIVAHVNHLIREEAKDDEIFVEKFCKKRVGR